MRQTIVKILAAAAFCSVSCLLLASHADKLPDASRSQTLVEDPHVTDLDFSDVPGTPPNAGEVQPPSFDFVLSE